VRIPLLLALLACAAPTFAQVPSRDGLTSGTRTLQDVAAERRLGKRPAGSGTFSVTGATGMPVLLSPVYGEGGSFEAVDRADAAHRPSAPAYASADPVLWPYLVYGGGTRTVIVRGSGGHGVHSASVAPKPAAQAPRVSSSGRTSGRKR
jgi:hypothetical protein